MNAQPHLFPPRPVQTPREIVAAHLHDFKWRQQARDAKRKKRIERDKRRREMKRAGATTEQISLFEQYDRPEPPPQAPPEEKNA